MSKLSLARTFVFVENCNWNIYSPYLRTDIDYKEFLIKYNVIDGTDNVVYGTNNVIYIGV